MKVKVLFFAAFRDITKCDDHHVVLSASARVADLLQALYHSFPALKPYSRHTRVAVNNEFAMKGTELRNGDEICLFPPVSGG